MRSYGYIVIKIVLEYCLSCRDDSGMTADGFTLIEMMVVLLIIGILIAIAVPTFMAVPSLARDKATQSILRSAFSRVELVYGDYSHFPPTVSLYQSGITQITFEPYNAPATSSGSNQVSIFPTNKAYSTANSSQTLILASWSSSGVCWAIRINHNLSSSIHGTWYAGKVASEANCTAKNTDAYTYYSSFAAATTGVTPNLP